MSKPTEVIVLCEDLRQSSFTLQYLRRCGINRGIRPILSPQGRGSAEQWVRRQYPVQVNAYRIARAKKHTWLIVVVDADTGTVAQRIQQMNTGLRQSEELRLRELNANNEMIIRLIPRRNIETWILALNAVTVDEIEVYKHTRTDDDWFALLAPATAALYTWTRPNTKLPDGLIDSLNYGIIEIRRVFQMAR